MQQIWQHLMHPLMQQLMHPDTAPDAAADEANAAADAAANAAPGVQSNNQPCFIQHLIAVQRRYNQPCMHNNRIFSHKQTNEFLRIKNSAP